MHAALVRVDRRDSVEQPAHLLHGALLLEVDLLDGVVEFLADAGELEEGLVAAPCLGYLILSARSFLRARRARQASASPGE